ncbi:MAG: amidohydrolase family protein [Rhodospirillaceae bacterium]|nr:amidohydrolase family protein [Rhodospirillaceae bacterium]
MRFLTLAFILVTALAVAARADVAITNVTLIDGTGGPAQPGVTVVTNGARIAAVGADVKIPRGMKRIDGTGKFLMPGLMDMHIHLIGAGQWRGLANPPGVAIDRDAALAYLHSYLYWGVTSVYDAGNVPDLILDLRAQERAGKIVSPRIFATGRALSYPGSWMAGTFHGVGVPDWPETQQVLDEQIAAQPDVQKLVMERFGLGPNPLAPHLPEDLMAKMVAYLHDHGVRTVIHASGEAFQRAALDAGIDSFAHPLGSARLTPEFTQRLAASQTPIATTMAVYDEIIRLGEDASYLDDPLFTSVLSADEIAARKAQGPSRYAALGWTGWFKALMPYYRENVRKLHGAGAVLVLATDRSEGPMLHRELELLADVGIPPAAIVRMGTLNGAVFLGRAADLGTVAPGKFADLLLLEADPTVDVRNMRRIAWVMKGGRIVDRAKLNVAANKR